MEYLMNDKAKIFEIFRSLQGEGKYAGVKQVFVRFCECNMSCEWCDTPVVINPEGQVYQELSIDEVLLRITELWENCHSVSLTGGEPLLHKDFIKALLPLLKKDERPVYLDTNGTLPEALAEVVHGIDIVAMDIKLPSSTRSGSFWPEHEEFLRVAQSSPNTEVFIKTIISASTLKDDVTVMVELLAREDVNIPLILQPNTFELTAGAVEKCLEFQNYCLKYLSDVRVIPQLHKFMNLR